MTNGIFLSEQEVAILADQLDSILHNLTVGNPNMSQLPWQPVINSVVIKKMKSANYAKPYQLDISSQMLEKIGKD